MGTATVVVRRSQHADHHPELARFAGRFDAARHLAERGAGLVGFDDMLDGCVVMAAERNASLYQCFHLHTIVRLFGCAIDTFLHEPPRLLPLRSSRGLSTPLPNHILEIAELPLPGGIVIEYEIADALQLKKLMDSWFDLLQVGTPADVNQVVRT